MDKQQDHSIFIEHLEGLFGGDSLALVTFMDWVTRLVRTPGCKVGPPVCLSASEEGLGLSLVGYALKKMIADRRALTLNWWQLVAPYNGLLEGCDLVVVEETPKRLNRDEETVLLDLLGSGTFVVNSKAQSPRSVKNNLNFLFISKHPGPQWALSCHADATQEVLAGDSGKDVGDYYGDLWGWVTEGGPERFAEFLKS